MLQFANFSALIIQMSNEEGNNRPRIGWYDSDSEDNLDSTALISSSVPGEICAVS